MIKSNFTRINKDVPTWADRHSKDKCKDELHYIEQHYQSFIDKDLDVENLFNKAFFNIANKFLKSINKFFELCRYLNGINKNVSIIKNVVASDRKENWHGHLQAVQDLLPIFREADCIDYLRNASFYLEIMRMLPTEHPEIYELFLPGHFVVKTNTGSFNGAAPDMKLEKNHSVLKKSSGGVIGQKSKKKFVTEWE